MKPLEKAARAMADAANPPAGVLIVPYVRAARTVVESISEKGLDREALDAASIVLAPMIGANPRERYCDRNGTHIVAPQARKVIEAYLNAILSDDAEERLRS